MKFATAYNAEYYDKKVWDHDLALMKDAGIGYIRYAEFAWAMMEPEEGKFDFSLIDDIVETAAKYGIKSILCTPTACPPVWLSQNYEVLTESIDGRTSEVGARQQRCYSSPDYLSHAYRIVEEMAKHYAGNENVVAWQIDNELCGEQKKCYCPRCRKKFDAYLEKKYGTIDNLNRRWGTQFWSERYAKFSEIPTPKHYASDLALWHNPGLNLDFVRFSSDNIIEFAKAQYDILRKYTTVPITTNTDDFRWGDTLDLYKLFSFLDIAGIDVYATDPAKLAFYSDFMRTVKPEMKKFWFLEFGDGNGSKEIYDLIASRGAELMEIYKFRPYPWGQEQSRDAMINIYGKPLPAYDLVKGYDKTADTPNGDAKSALLYDFQSSWAWHAKSMFFPGDFDEGGSALRYPFYLEKTVYRAMFEALPKENGKNALIDIVNDDYDFSKYDLLVVPAHFVYNEKLECALMDFVKNGGTLVADTHLFEKDEFNAFPETMPRIMTELFGLPCDEIVNGKTVTKAGRTVSYGKGKAVLVKGDLSLREWKNILWKL